MLEKIGLPPKPSLRGNNWVIDATHCQGCSSQFTFINRKHHCRRCGGLFCGSCTQQRMYLRGQGESPVRICDPCKTLEEAARFELRYGHKNKTRKGSSKLTSDNEDNESVSPDKETSMQRTTSASCSNNETEFDFESTTPEELKKRAVEEKKKYKDLKAKGKPEEALRAFKRGKELERQAAALEIELRKNRKKTISSSSTNESVRKQPKEKDDLVNELKELGWSDVDIKDGDKKPVNMTLEGELSSLLKEVSQKSSKPVKDSIGIKKSEVVAIKKNALALKREGKLTEAKEELKRAKILEKQIEEEELLGDDDDESDDEFASLIRSMDIDKKDILEAGNDLNRNINFDLDFDHDGPNFEDTDEDLYDPEMSAALQSLGWEEEEEEEEDNAIDNKESLLSEIKMLKQKAVIKKREGNTAEALELLKKAKLLEANINGFHESQEKDDLLLKLESDNKTTPPKKMNKLAIQRELLALKKKALALRREGKVEEAEKELLKGKVLEEQLEEMENGPKVKPTVDFSVSMEVEDEKEDVTDMDMNDPSYLSVLQNLGWQEEDNDMKVEAPKQKIMVSSKKSKSEIQRELLGLKRKSLALRRQGNVEEAEEVLKTTKELEAQLAEMEAPKQEIIVNEIFIAEKEKEKDKEKEKEKEKEKPQISDEKPRVVVNESTSIQQRVLAHKRKAVSLKREGKLAEAKEELKQAKLLEKENIQNLNVEKQNMEVYTGDKTPLPSSSKTNVSDDVNAPEKEETENSPPPKLSSRERFKLQQESLSHKRNALKLRREGRNEEAEAEFELAKNLESQLEAATESTKQVNDVSVEDLFDPQLLSALREVGIEGGVSQSSPEKSVVVNKSQTAAVNKSHSTVVNKEKTELEDEIKAEKVKAVKLKRAGKQAEALDAFRRAKLLEKKLNSLA